LLNVILHEMGHVIGIGTIWSYKGVLTGAGTSDPRYTGANAVAEYNSIFGLSASSIPVENTGGSGTRDAHWRETVFNNELMTGFLNSGTNPLSRITVAMLADLGYTVDSAAADSYTPPGSLTTVDTTSSADIGASLQSAEPREIPDSDLVEWAELAARVDDTLNELEELLVDELAEQIPAQLALSSSTAVAAEQCESFELPDLDEFEAPLDDLLAEIDWELGLDAESTDSPV
ncbi:MAG: hypothetical protein KDA92_20595, partial [Planctomycetales bacterium]|nr:hypothetical protein [Planctomycetales bacterium]